MTMDAAAPIQVLRDTSSLTLALAYINHNGREYGEERTLRFWRGDFFKWDGVIYRRLEPEEFRGNVHNFLKSVKVKKRGAVEMYKPEPRNVKAVIDTLAAECQAYAESMPAWIDKHRPDPADVIAFQNGLLNLKDVGTGQLPVLLPPTPMWFSTIVIPYDFRANLACPRWIGFLNSTLRKNGTVDQGAIALLQEWFGYCMTADTRHQKLMLLVGPPRCGKGTIIRAMQRVVGSGNCASPQFSSLTESFGLEPLIGKRVACVPDAHLGRDDNAVGVLDRILQISGEDTVTVNRKYLKALPDVKLGVRFTIGANEPPDLPDTSAAIISRLLMIHFHESFVGREDLNLDTHLANETAGIAAWAIEGLRRLRAHGEFTQPSDAEKLKNDYMRQTSPVQAFLQDRCEFGTSDEHYTGVEELWAAWKTWATNSGHHPGSKEGFAKRLRAANPLIYRARRTRDMRQVYEYAGLMLLQEGTLRFRPGDVNEE